VHVSLETVQAHTDDPFGKILTLEEAAATVGVTVRSVRRWITNGHLTTLPGGRHVLERHVRECERDRHIASRQGRPRRHLPVSA
jgi:excisionase family DNA binding protein